MVHDQISDEVKRGRSMTNECLSTERVKTDKTLRDLKDERQSKTKENIDESRSSADERKKKVRSKTDSQSAPRLNDNSTRRELKDQLNEHLQEERAAVDEILVSERRDTDDSIAMERHEEGVAERDTIEQERVATDESLSTERGLTDIELVKSATELSHEKKEHTSAKSRLASREEILAIVSHDLRNPISAVLSSAELLRNFSMSSDEKELVDFIYRGASHALRLIEDLINMEAIETQNFRINLSPCDLRETAKHAMNALRKESTEKSIKVTLDVPQTPVMAIVDENRITQVLINLLGNAIKFTSKSGHVSLSMYSTPGEVKVEIRDTGPGVPEEKRDQIFERFSQLQDRSRTGLGLGLFISKKIILQHNGNIWITNNDGQGACFHFTLPLKKDNAAN